MIIEAIKKLVAGSHLTQSEAQAVFEQIMSGEATDAQIGAYLIAQKMTGESVDEITGAARVMRQKATPIPTQQTHLVDTCGTGGDASGTFNISTTAAFIAAGAGVAIAKHGNRSVSSKSGSADVLKAIGVELELTPQQVGECIDDVGIGFLFAPLLHGAMKYAIGPRRELGQRSIFNLLGPLTNPAGAKRQVMGVFDLQLTRPLAEVQGELGAEHVWIVCGEDGLDEISLCAPTKVVECKRGEINEFTLSPEDYGFKKCDVKELAGNSPEENATHLLNILKGEKGPRRDIAVLNAAAAILVAGQAKDFAEGIQKAQASIDEKLALAKLENLISKTRSFKA